MPLAGMCTCSCYLSETADLQMMRRVYETVYYSVYAAMICYCWVSIIDKHTFTYGAWTLVARDHNTQLGYATDYYDGPTKHT